MSLDDTALQRQRNSLGALMLIGLGGILLALNVIPTALHGALILGCIALVFGAFYAFGLVGQRWARIPAFFFGSLAVALFFHMLFFHSGEHDIPGFGLPLWPLVLIIAGLWVMRRERRWA